MSFLNPDTLRANTFLRHIELHETLGSTNDRALELARDANIEVPALIAARHQTAGRGRGQNTWQAADGALTFSVLLGPRSHGVETSAWPQLSLTTAVAICDALINELTHQRAGASPPPSVTVDRPEATEVPSNLDATHVHGPEDGPARSSANAPRIKWPNDIYLAGRKLAGILIESPGGPRPAKDRLVIGVGINVNNSCGNAPSDVALNAIALCDVTNRNHDLQTLLINVLNSLAARIDQLALLTPDLPLAWQRLDALAGQHVAIETEHRRVEGKSAGIDRDGAIVIETPAGIKRFMSGRLRRIN